MLKDFRTYRLAVEFYARVSALRVPPHLKNQFLRAASSVALNLAEAYGRQTPADRRRHFVIALGSLRECQAALDLIGGPKGPLADMADHLGGCLYKLSRPGL